MNGQTGRWRRLGAAVTLALGLSGAFGASPALADDLTISGNVQGSAGSVSGIVVTACTTDWTFCVWSGSTTDEAGSFSLGGLVPGSYIVRFDTSARPRYLDSYYVGPGTAWDREAATPVDASAGSVVLTNVQLAVAGSITGHVQMAAGPSSWPTVIATGNHLVVYGNVAANGDFSVTGLIPGSYTLRFADDSNLYVAGWYDGHGLVPQDTGAVAVTVPEGNVALDPFEWSQGVTLTGKLSGSQGGLENYSVQVWDEWGNNHYLQVAQDGSFRIGGMWPSSYRLYISGAGPYVEGNYDPSTGTLVESNSPRLVVGSNGLDLGTITLEVGQSISGAVSDWTGGYIDVEACRDDGSCGWTQITGLSGTFSVSGLRPGGYRLSFRDYSGTYASGYYSTTGIVSDPAQATVFTMPPSVTDLNLSLRGGGGPTVRVPDPVTDVVAVPGDGSVTISWTAPLSDGGSPITGYQVVQSSGPGAPAECFTQITSCTIDGLTNGAAYTFVVVAQNIMGSSPAASPANAVTPIAPAPPAVRLAVTAPATGTANTPVTVTVSAVDASGKVVPDYRGQVTITTSDSRALLPDAWTFTAADAGTHQFSLTPRTAGTWTVTVSDGTLEAGSASISVAPVAVRLVATAPATAAAGKPFSVTVSAVDADGKVVPGYRGQVALSSTDAKAVLPGSYAFDAGDAGTHVFNITLGSVGTWSVTARDGSLQAGTASVKVAGGAPAAVAFVNPRAATAGVMATYRLQVVDASGNRVANFSGYLSLATGDPHASMPARVRFKGGQATFKAIFRTAGLQSVTVGSTRTFTTALSVQVLPGATHRLTVAASEPIVAGAPATVTVTAFDRFGNVAAGYHGTVRITTLDNRVLLAPEYQFTAADAGSHQFSVTFKTSGWHWIRVTDRAGHMTAQLRAEVHRT